MSGFARRGPGPGTGRGPGSGLGVAEFSDAVRHEHHPDRSEPVAGILLAVARITRRIGARRPFAGTPLSRSQFDAVFLLAHGTGPMTPSRLATELGLTAGAVSQLVDGLREAGHVDIGPHPTDGRSRVLSLSAAAAKEVDAFQQGLVRELAPDFVGLDDAELQQLAALLARAVGR